MSENQREVPVFANRNQISVVCGCAAELIDKIHRAGAVPHQARDMNGKPLWSADSVPRMQRAVQFVKAGNPVRALRWLDHKIDENAAALARELRAHIKTGWTEAADQLAATPNVALEYERQFGQPPPNIEAIDWSALVQEVGR